MLTTDVTKSTSEFNINKAIDTKLDRLLTSYDINKHNHHFDKTLM